MDEDLHDEAMSRGLIRYCPICDGYEVTDKKVGVIGSGSHGVAEALFIRSYTADITLIAPDKALELGVVDEVVQSTDELLERSRAWVREHPDAEQPWDVKGFKIPGGTPASPALARIMEAL